jgi:hypothetical protein
LLAFLQRSTVEGIPAAASAIYAGHSSHPSHPSTLTALSTLSDIPHQPSQITHHFRLRSSLTTLPVSRRTFHILIFLNPFIWVAAQPFLAVSAVLCAQCAASVLLLCCAAVLRRLRESPLARSSTKGLSSTSEGVRQAALHPSRVLPLVSNILPRVFELRAKNGF